jgi:hypothetical protein
MHELICVPKVKKINSESLLHYDFWKIRRHEVKIKELPLFLITTPLIMEKRRFA